MAGIERRDFFEIEIAAVQFFDAVAPDGKRIWTSFSG
jgi:hypothetical protein